jgi:Asparagine synthase
VASTVIATLLPNGATAVAVGEDENTTDLERVSRIATHLRLRTEIDLAAVLEPGHIAALLASEFDEPMADAGAVSRYAMYADAQRYTSAVLTGHGAAAFWDLPPNERPLFDDALRHSLYTRRFSWQVREADPVSRYPNTGVLWLTECQLALAHAASGLTGLRLLHPFLDRDLADLGYRLPARLKRRGEMDMYSLRHLASRRLPTALLPPIPAVAPKRGWLSNALRALVPQVLFGERFDSRGIFSRPALQTLWDEHRDGREDHADRLWSVLMLELWFREFVDDDAAAYPNEFAVLVRAA